MSWNKSHVESIEMRRREFVPFRMQQEECLSNNASVSTKIKKPNRIEKGIIFVEKINFYA
jgi:hypothetical protein